MKRVIIVGGGFAGLNAARGLGNSKEVEVTLLDRRNHHLFQPLLYQVAMAGLSPAEIAVPIRGLMARYSNVQVLQSEVRSIDLGERKVIADRGEFAFDYLILACGAKHTYFGNEHWEKHAPGLKNLEQATEIRRRVLQAFEDAEGESDAQRRRRLLTFIIVGGGPTGVELAGAIGEMSRFTLAKDFRRIDPKLTRVILVEADSRILPSFDPELAAKATRGLETLGVQVWTSSVVTDVDEDGIEIGEERVKAATVVWAAGVRASGLGTELQVPLDRQGRVFVESDLSIPDHPCVFVAGDQAHFKGQDGRPLPGQAPAALQQGRYLSHLILEEIKGKPRRPFSYVDKGQMATIGRSNAIAESGRLRLSGFLAWLVWLVVHIYYLTGFRNRILVVIQWAWAYLSFGRGARLIVEKDWRFYS